MEGHFCCLCNVVVLAFSWGARFVIEALVVRRYGAALANAIVQSSGWFTGIVLAAAAVAIFIWCRRRAKTEVEPEM